MQLLLAVILVILSLSTRATVTSGASDCPIQFEGKIKQVIEPIGPHDFLSTSKVVFENHKTLKGSVSDSVSLDILQNGPFKIEEDKEYRVHLRHGRLCWMEQI